MTTRLNIRPCDFGSDAALRPPPPPHLPRVGTELAEIAGQVTHTRRDFIFL